jgi:hypothetical protein
MTERAKRVLRAVSIVLATLPLIASVVLVLRHVR